MSDNLEALEIELDLRLRSLWDRVGEADMADPGVFWAFMRAAYGYGYVDACREEDPGKWARDLGYNIRRKA